MEWIDRYVYAVTQRLPERQREEISKELQGLIEDMLEEQTHHKEPEAKDVEQVLLQLGPPAQMAAKYRGHDRYLIGPALFDAYWSTIKIVTIAIFISLSVIFAIESILEPTSILNHFIDSLGSSLFIAVLHGFFWVTVVFAIIEYNTREKPLDSDEAVKQHHWTPDSLPPIPAERSQIKLAEPVAGIIFTIIFTVIFMFRHDLIAVNLYRDGVFTSIPIMNPDVIGKFLPYIGAMCVLTVMKEVWKVIVRRRVLSLLIVHISLNLLGFVFAAVLVQTPGFWNVNFLEQLQTTGLLPTSGGGYDTVKTIWYGVTNNLVYLIGLATLIDSVAEWYKWRQSRLR